MTNSHAAGIVPTPRLCQTRFLLGGFALTSAGSSRPLGRRFNSLFYAVRLLG
jgi:hypothetical protein